jgi:hypothetical protein
MKITSTKWLRGMLLSIAYILGVIGIVASGGGGGSSGDGSARSCGLSIQSIAPATDGTGDIWVGALSKTAEGENHSVNRLRSNGSEKASYSFGYATNEELVQAIAIATDPLNANKVYAGGDFTDGILRLNEDGSLDGSFVVGSGFDGRVSSIVPAADGSGDIYVGGFFSNYDGTGVSGLVRLTSNGSLDNVGFTAAGASTIESVALATDAPFLGYIYSGGSGGVARWNNSGTKDVTFNPPIGRVFSVTPAADATDAIYVGGTAATGVVRLNSNGTVDGSFDNGTGFNAETLSIVRAGDMTGDIYAGGWFTSYDGGSANGIIRLNSNGSREVNFLVGNGFTNSPNDPFPFSMVFSLARATDGSTDIYVGGGFAFYDGARSNGIVRLNDNGSLDTGFAVQIAAERGLCTNDTILGLD